jgi:hypothetical protein
VNCRWNKDAAGISGKLQHGLLCSCCCWLVVFYLCAGCLQQSKIGGGNAAAAAGAGSVNVYGARRTSSSLLMDVATQVRLCVVQQASGVSSLTFDAQAHTRSWQPFFELSRASSQKVQYALY